MPLHLFDITGVSEIDALSRVWATITRPDGSTYSGPIVVTGKRNREGFFRFRVEDVLRDFPEGTTIDVWEVTY